MRLRRMHVYAVFRAIKNLTSLSLILERQKFLLSEVKKLRLQLNEDRGALYPTIEQTRASFAYQWKNMPTGKYLPSDRRWMGELRDQISQYFDEPPEAFRHKSVLDYGCGGGRYALGFCRLGADVSVYDIEENIVQSAINLCASYGYESKRHYGYRDKYDYVWCFGVVHHTGRTYHHIQNVIQLLKSGGKLFLMVYGFPEDYDQYVTCNFYNDTAQKLSAMTFDEKVSYLSRWYPKDEVHGMFDAVSPQVADLMPWEELHGLLTHLGMTDIKRTLIGHRNHFIVGRKKE